MVCFELDGSNNLVTQSGYFVEPGLDHADVVPRDRRWLRMERSPWYGITPTRTIGGIGDDAPRDGIRVDVGRLGLSRFVNPSGLESIGENLFQETETSQPGIDGFPGEDGMGEVYSGWLEASNVDIATEMTQLVLASRAYQLNLHSVPDAGKMLTEANQIV